MNVTLFFQILHLLNTPKGFLQFSRQRCLPYAFREYELLSAQLSDAGQIVLLTRYMSTVADLLVSQELGRPLIRLFTAFAGYRVWSFGAVTVFVFRIRSRQDTSRTGLEAKLWLERPSEDTRSEHWQLA